MLLGSVLLAVSLGLRDVDPRNLPSGSLIEGKAKRYKVDDGPEASQQYSAMTVNIRALLLW